MKTIIRCKDCPLWKKQEEVCSILVLIDGEKFELPTKADDACVWVKNGLENDVDFIRAWSDGKKGYFEISERDVDLN